MDSNFLLNVQRIMVFMRFNISSPQNTELVDILTNCMNSNCDNCLLVDLISNRQGELREQLLLEEGEGYGTNNNIKSFLLQMLEFISEGVDTQNYDMAYDIVDMLHVLPDVIIANDRKQLKQYWKIYVKPVLKRRKRERVYEIKKTYYFK